MASTIETLRALGRTDLQVSSVSMGCWAIVGDSTWGRQDEAQAVATIRAAVDAGINFFDTAEMYGNGYSEELLAKALEGRREGTVVASKVSPAHTRSWSQLETACEASLRRLGRDCIDLYYLHWPCRDVPIADLLGWFDRLQCTGKIRWFGVSNFGKEDLSELLDHGRCEVNQLPYSLLWRVIENEILPLCRANAISVACYSPLAQGLLTGKFASPDDVPAGRARTRHFSCDRPQARHREPGCERETFAALGEVAGVARETGVPMAELALAWLLHQEGVASVVAGARSPEQVRQNARAMTLDLSADVLARLSGATDVLKARFGNNPDMWQTDSRYR
ncbi:MAG: aldo/keto reductase [Kiritimatiellaeota bacterium]|nr:aldo/keto reductase [Kiritimatiellota bacterium]